MNDALNILQEMDIVNRQRALIDDLQKQLSAAIALIRAIDDSKVLFKHDIILDAHVSAFLNALDKK